MLEPNRLSKKTKSKKRFQQPLGRGLESLLGESPTNIQPEARIWNIALYKITPKSTQPRKIFEKDKLRQLALSIKQQGILQPIIVRRTSDSKFEVLAGERRWRASQMAGLKTIPAIVKDVDEEAHSLELALIENIQRENLNPIEEARAYQQLLLKYKLTQEQISQKVGKDRATIANALRLLKLDPQVQKLISERELSAGHAKLLLTVSSASRQRKLARQVIQQKLSVRKLESIKSHTPTPSGKKSKASHSLKDKLILKIAEGLQKKLGTKVKIEDQKGKGKISIYYYSNEQLTALSEGFKHVKK